MLRITHSLNIPEGIFLYLQKVTKEKDFFVNLKMLDVLRMTLIEYERSLRGNICVLYCSYKKRIKGKALMTSNTSMFIFRQTNE